MRRLLISKIVVQFSWNLSPPLSTIVGQFSLGNCYDKQLIGLPWQRPQCLLSICVQNFNTCSPSHPTLRKALPLPHPITKAAGAPKVHGAAEFLAAGQALPCPDYILHSARFLFSFSHLHSVPMAATSRDEFLEVYQTLKAELLEDTEAFTYTDDSRRWVERMLDYNVPKGKLNRGVSVVDSLKHLKFEADLMGEEKFLASVLGWCIEWLQAYFLVLDDIMDSSITRRGQPCWYRVPQVGLIAINDGILLRNHIFRMLKLHFRNKAYYLELNDLFNEVEFQTSCGQMLDLITTPAGEIDLSKYVMSTYLKIVQCKTAYYSFYLPVACALLMMGKNLEDFKSTKDILVSMGTYFQVQDDYLDCYGDPQFIGKIGTDIEDSKCSWLIVQALKRANADQRQCLLDNYGKADPACVSKVKTVYKELALQAVFLEYEKEVYSKLVAEIESQGDQAVQTVLKVFLGKIYKRQK